MSCRITSGVEHVPANSNVAGAPGGASDSNVQEQTPRSQTIDTAPSPGVSAPWRAMQSALMAQLGSERSDADGPSREVLSNPALAKRELPMIVEG